MTTDSPSPDTDGPPRATDVDTVVDAIGLKIRQLRQERGLSLQQLAVRCTVSAAAIHKVERGDMVPTITTLLKIATALGRPISYFVGEDEGREEPAWYTPAHSRPAAASNVAGVEAAGISGPTERFRSAGTVVTVAPEASVLGRPSARPAEHLVLVLDGSVEFEVSGARYTLRKGDALHYAADRPHRYSNPGGRPARLVWFSSLDS
jgi:transcriptional regulator with XRE-family HTH domain